MVEFLDILYEQYINTHSDRYMLCVKVTHFKCVSGELHSDALQVDYKRSETHFLSTMLRERERERERVKVMFQLHTNYNCDDVILTSLCRSVFSSRMATVNPWTISVMECV